MAGHEYSDEENEIIQIVSENIVYYRKKSEKSQKEVAEEMGWEKGNYQKIEWGQTNSSIVVIGKVAKAINTTPDKLLKKRNKK